MTEPMGIDKATFEHARMLQREFPRLRASEIYATMMGRKGKGLSDAEHVEVMREFCRFADERGLTIAQADDMFTQYFVEEQERRRR